MFFLRHLNITAKFILLLALPIVLIVYFVGTSISEKTQTKEEMANIQEVSQLASKLSLVIHETQKERGATGVYLGSKGSKFQEELPAQQKLTDTKIAELEAFLSSFDKTKFGTDFSEALDSALNDFGRREAIRAQVSNQSIPINKALGYYTAMNGKILDTITSTTKISSNKEISNSLTTYVNFMQGKERAGIERAVMSATLGANKFSDMKQFSFLVTLISAQNTYFNVFKSTATPHQQEFFNSTLQGKAVKEVQRIRDIAITKASEGNFGIDSGYWFKQKTQEINMLKEIEDKLSADVIEKASALKEQASAELQFSLMLALMTLGICVMGVIIGRSITKPLGQLATHVRNVEQTGDFSSRIQTNSNDEIGKTIHAYNHLMESLESSIGNVNGVMDGLAKGDFSKRVDVTVQGDLNTLKTNVNDSIQRVDTIMGELGAIMNALSQGQFAYTSQNKSNQAVEGQFKESLDMALKAMQAMSAAIGNINGVMSSVASGDFKQRITVDAEGDLDNLKQSINHSMQTLDATIDNINGVMSSVAEGDLQQRMTVDAEGDLENLKQNVNRSIDSLEATLSDVTSSSHSVTSGVEQTSVAVQEVSQGSQRQMSSISQLAEALNQTSQAVSEVTQNAASSRVAVNEAIGMARAGQEQMLSMVNVVNQISENSKQINTITEMIGGIASQTNLLALNATIEAASAGDAGKGFAVVANEVKELAKQSAESVNSINELIEKATQQASEAVDTANTVDSQMRTIMDNIEQSGTRIESIAASMEEQNTIIQSITGNVDELRSISETNAAAAEEISANSVELSKMATNTNQQVERFQVRSKFKQAV